MLGSRFGAVLGLGFLALIAFAFAAGDISQRADGGLFGPSSGQAAKVGDAELTVSELQSRVQRVFDLNRRDNPELTMDAFLSAGGFDEVLTQLISGLALVQFGTDHDMAASRKLVDAEIARVPAFQDATGRFSQAQFEQMLRNERITPQDLRNDLTRQIMERQLIQPAVLGVQAPAEMARRYASMLLEERKGTVAAIPSQAFLPESAPTEAELKAYYAQAGSRFALPERRKLRYAMMDAASLAEKAKPTEAEIQQYYKANASRYAAGEQRVARRLVLPTEKAAKDMAARIGPTGSLDEAARSAGLTATSLEPMDKAAFARQVNAAAANQLFAAPANGVVGPVKIDLGWALFRVTEIRTVPGRSLDQVRPEITAALTADKSRQALSELANKVDGAVAEGETFADVVKAYGLTATETPALTEDGRNPEDPAQQIDPALLPILKGGFAMEQDDDPQLVTVTPDQRVALVALDQIVPAGPPPLGKVRPLVERAYLLSRGAAEAKKLAEALRKTVDGGAGLAQAVAGAGVPLPAVDTLSAQRAQLGQRGAQVPPALIALFSMKKGATRVLPLDNDAGFVVLHLDEITPGDASGNAQMLEATRGGLSKVLEGEYAAQFGQAITRAVGVTRNEAAIARVKTQVRGGSEPAR